MPSETRRAFAEDGENKTHIGGQALIEGVMMRGKIGWAAAIRKPDGSIYVEESPLSKKERPSWMSWPLVRGCVAFVDSLVLGFKALEAAANNAYDQEGYTYAELQKRSAQGAPLASSPTKPGQSDIPCPDEGGHYVFEQAGEGTKPSGPQAPVGNGEANKCVLPAEAASSSSAAKKPEGAEPSAKKPEADEGGFFGKAEMGISMVLGVALGVALFILLPALISNLLVGDYDSNPLAWNILDGVLRVAVFVAYIWLISLMPDIKRMFAYHGAEHKTIHCLEHGLELTPENARSFPRLHVRCGTAFLVMVMILAILVYTIIPVDKLIVAWGISDSILKFILVVVVRIVFMPLIAGITYEVTVKWAGSNPEKPLVKIVLWPGMQMQRLTTNEPDDGMLECAIAATKAVMAQECRG
ncbi:MAG: DUF1385 domain-containing protein [Coriobacteriia bacterium]|nr:DUF1385 domain-containing protein [Coriobacteriia bacterium]